jgi:hypothetical protein
MVITERTTLIAVDSSTWIDRLRSRASPAVEKLGQILEEQVIVVGDIVLLEILQGARDDLQASKLERLMTRYHIVEMLDTKIAIRCASNFRTLRSKGFTVRKTPDLIIGTWCIENDCPLLHNDRDFLPMVEHLGLKEF